MNTQKNNIVIISGPSGAGEDSIIDGLAKILPIERIITTTTRQKRPGESEGHPYYFVTPEEFQNGIKNNKFLEYAQEYNGHHYGVTFAEIERIKNCGKIGIWKIEYKGVITAKKLMPDVIAIFIDVPLDELERRIRHRSQVTDEYVKTRMTYTEEWLQHLDVYDYRVDNERGKLQEAIQKIEKIIKEEISGGRLTNILL